MKQLLGNAGIFEIYLRVSIFRDLNLKNKTSRKL
jgi:hypothetical protein